MNNSILYFLCLRQGQHTQANRKCERRRVQGYFGSTNRNQRLSLTATSLPTAPRSAQVVCFFIRYSETAGERAAASRGTPADAPRDCAELVTAGHATYRGLYWRGRESGGGGQHPASFIVAKHLAYRAPRRSRRSLRRRREGNNV